MENGLVKMRAEGWGSHECKNTCAMNKNSREAFVAHENVSSLCLSAERKKYVIFKLNMSDDVLIFVLLLERNTD